MSDLYTSEQRMRLADELLNHPLIVEAVIKLHASYVLAARRCDLKDDIGRFRYAVAQDVIDGVQDHLKAVIALGKLSQKQNQEFQADTIKAKITRIF